MKTLKILVPAGGSVQLTEMGNFVRIREPGTGIFVITAYSNAGGSYGYEVEAEAGEPIRFEQGFAYVTIKTKDGSAESLKLDIGYGSTGSAKFTGTVAVESGEVEVTGGNINVAGDVSVLPMAGFSAAANVALVADTETIIAANAARKMLLLYAPESNSESVWIGTDTVGVGIPMLPGAVMQLPVTGAVSVITGGTGCVLNVGEFV